MATIVHNNNNLISLCTTKSKYIHNIIMLTCRVLSILRTKQHPMQYNSKSKKNETKSNNANNSEFNTQNGIKYCIFDKA